MVIDFSASWCAPCRSMEPTINEYASKYTDVEFIKIDVDELMNRSAGDANVHTRQERKVVDKITGARKEELQNKIEKHRGYYYCA
ncbi:hypothetical protein C3L33_09085, partial [Rhododendron williamsianum]